MASKVYDFTLSASGTQRFDVRGNYCKLTASTGAVIVKADTGEEWALLAGQGFRLPADAPFGALTMRNVSGAANVGTIFIGDSFFEDSRITGSVSIIDDAAQRTAQGLIFQGFTFSAAGAGVFPATGIYSGSRQVAIRRIIVFSSVAQAMDLFYGSGIGTSNPSSGVLRNKFLGSANSLSVMTAGTAASRAPTALEIPGVVQIPGFPVPANASYELPQTFPFVLTAGQYFGFHGSVANSTVNLFLEVQEL